MTVKCERCGKEYESKRDYIPNLCSPCDVIVGKKATELAWQAQRDYRRGYSTPHADATKEKK